MTYRPSFYRDIHKGIRALLFDVVQKSGRLDFSDNVAVARYRAELQTAIDFLMSHAEHENQFVGPLLAQHAPELARRISGIHEEQEKELPELLAMIDRGAAHGFVLELARISGELLVHMTEEEEVLMPALWASMTDAEIIAAHDALVASIPPHEMAFALSWMLPSMNAPERAELLTALRASAPPEVFGFVRGLAKSVLSAADDEALEQRLAA
ncbi:MAG TPA: hemerythrin domain-containing protein [Thermoanaerobaculia bacterium]|jgi:iron-sulfur cluster repair protein YtfE (RIC family)|nr:hemerythrin domain-containing protein [Thermoanaerobaculia bacterium]